MARSKSPFNYVKDVERKDNNSIFRGGPGSGEVQPGGNYDPNFNPNMPSSGPRNLPKQKFTKPISMTPSDTAYNPSAQRPGPREEYGQGMTSPGSQSGLETWIDWHIGSGGYGDATPVWGVDPASIGLSNQGINNMNDLYDWWMSGGSETVPGGGGHFDTFMDWYNELSASGSGTGTYNFDLPFQTPTGYGFTPTESGNEVGWYGSGAAANWQSGASQQGGTGDLGTGSNFAGGGMGNSMFGEGITNPFGVGWGPEGQYESGEGTGMDPDWNQWGDECLSAYQASGSDDSYSDFANAMCGDV